LALYAKVYLPCMTGRGNRRRHESHGSGRPELRRLIVAPAA